MCLIAAIACAVAWVWRGRAIKSEPMSYYFRGEFCGVQLWEYSAHGQDVAIWAEWTTNFANSGPPHVLVVRTSTVAQYLRK